MHHASVCILPLRSILHTRLLCILLTVDCVGAFHPQPYKVECPAKIRQSLVAAWNERLTPQLSADSGTPWLTAIMSDWRLLLMILRTWAFYAIANHPGVLGWLNDLSDGEWSRVHSLFTRHGQTLLTKWLGAGATPATISPQLLPTASWDELYTSQSKLWQRIQVSCRALRCACADSLLVCVGSSALLACVLKRDHTTQVTRFGVSSSRRSSIGTHSSTFLLICCDCTRKPSRQ